MTQPLTRDEMSVLQVLAFFFLSTGNAAAAERTVRAMLSVDPQHEWARQFLILCTDAKGDYAKAEQLTQQLEQSAFAHFDAKQRALLLIRARALQKLGLTEEAQALCRRIMEAAGAVK